MTTTFNVAIVFASGYGHTKAVAEAVAEGANGVEGVTATLYHLPEVDWDALDQADAIIFGSPTYMGNVSAPFAQFKDDSSKRWFSQAWKNKVAAGFTVSASWSGDKNITMTTLQILALQHGMVWVGLDLMPGNNSSAGSPDDLNNVGATSGLFVQANADQGNEGIRESSFATARHFGQRVALATRRWGKEG